MSGTEFTPIYVRATAKRNGITSLVLGGAGLAVSVVFLRYFSEWLFLAGIFLTSASIVALLVGWFKLREPEHSIAITKERIDYRHRLGGWHLDWDNVQRVDCPRVRQGMDHVPLEAVGFRLREYGPFLRAISPRLATHILMEQRPLLLHSEDENCATGSCYQQSMFDDKQYVLEDGEVLTGIKAMLANRMTQLREQLGFDVFLSASDLDRPPQEFAAWMKQCQSSRLSPSE